MQTSYFANLHNIIKAGLPYVAICGKSPIEYKGPEFKQLAPKWSFFKEWKDGKIDNNGYIKEYDKLVLSNFNPEFLYNRLISTYGDDLVLLCYEKPGEFCHRRLVARWFETKLGIIVPEFTII